MLSKLLYGFSCAKLIVKVLEVEDSLTGSVVKYKVPS